MKVSVVLYSYLRDKLPAEAKGQAVLELQEGARIADLIARLDLPERVLFALNNQIEGEASRELRDGDVVRFFRAGAGG
ncbi:MAG TPA: MoaD/ThiS family protein [Anaerolineaceae bacterium]|nr:MoaD/ThiS family protein [Anaerolineaceae bacterium]